MRSRLRISSEHQRRSKIWWCWLRRPLENTQNLGLHLLSLCPHTPMASSICRGLIECNGARINIFGKTELLPQSLRDAISMAEMMSRQNNKICLNYCIPYTSQHEITNAVQSTINQCNSRLSTPGLPLCDDTITEKDIEAELMTSKAGCPSLDILIRTSGVKRLSDFLLWQCCENTQIQFCSKSWPEFSLLTFVSIILDYQRKAWSRCWSMSYSLVLMSRCCKSSFDLSHLCSTLIQQVKFNRLKIFIIKSSILAENMLSTDVL